MSVSTMRFSLTRFLNTRAFDRVRASSTIYLVFLGPFMAFVTYVVLGPFDLRALVFAIFGARLLITIYFRFN